MTAEPAEPVLQPATAEPAEPVLQPATAEPAEPVRQAAPAEPEHGYAAALAALPWMTPTRLARLIGDRAPSRAWTDVLAGRAGEAWATAARRVAVGDVAAAHVAAGVGIALRGEPGYPHRLVSDPEPPAVLFRLGTLPPKDAPAVGIVGTRRCTHYGREVAADMARELAAAGVVVVSGLALGIDGAAHEGALAARGAGPLGVVASGLDVIYPRRHARLWTRVAEAGALVSEAPLCTPPEAWRFPLRNRVIVALSDVVVVVESHPAGGSMHTVDAAIARGVTVMAVPGPVRSSASAGTNRLLAEGCPPACETADVMTALGLVPRRGEPPAPPSTPSRLPLEGDEAAVLEAVGWSPTALEQVLQRTSMAPARAAAALARLDDAGWVRGEGGWWERTG